MSILTTSDVNAFFGDALDDALSEEKVSTSAPLRAYLVEVLACRAARGEARSAPITLAFSEAMAAPPRERFERLKEVGDRSLTETGLFAESLERRGVDPAYVEGLGKRAYGTASALVGGGDRFDVLGELSREFERVVRAVREVGNLLFAGSPQDERGLLRTYERWQRTQSPALARSLVQRGFLPQRGPGGAH